MHYVLVTHAVEPPLRGITFDIGDKKRIYEMNSWQIAEQIFRGGAGIAPREAV
jgi:hypothetical protein